MCSDGPAFSSALCVPQALKTSLNDVGEQLVYRGLEYWIFVIKKRLKSHSRIDSICSTSMVFLKAIQ